MDWCEPRDLRDWFNRFFSLRSLTFILIVLLLAVFEFRFDWMEKALGSYLSTTNRQRPETGDIWETAHDTQQARNSLDEITVDREALQRNARGALDLSDVISYIADNQSVMISPDHFRSLYMKLPSGIASRIIPPNELLQLLGEKEWERTYFRKFGNQLTIYLINRSNRVLREIVVADSTLVQIERRKIVFNGSLEEWGTSPDRIYPADRFFYALDSLPEDVQAEILAQPEEILNAGGRLVRVGFPPQLQTVWVDIGFELDDGSQRQVIVLPAREWALWRLRSVMENMAAGFAPISPGQEARTEP
ncbi:MAG: hypothetical protein JXR49_08040 [Acidobacteria bacterium]|nr:hypothetical protein [Acidobacteriota bacterium]